MIALAAQPATNSAGAARPWPTSLQQQRDGQRRHHHHAGHEVGGQVGEHAEVGDAVEVLDRERAGRRAGHQADHEQGDRSSRGRAGASAIGQGRPTARGGRGQTSASATSEAVAQNDISKPGCTTTSGSASRMISAASASERRLIACRSSRMATKATDGGDRRAPRRRRARRTAPGRRRPRSARRPPPPSCR